MEAEVSKVYAHDNHYRLFVLFQGNSKGWEFPDKKEAVKARAKLVKQLKVDGIKVKGFH